MSQVATIEKVRKKLVDIQREMIKNSPSILDGRDIGTHVFKDTQNKFYLNASPKEKLTRRYNELIDKGYSVDLDEIIEYNREYLNVKLM